VSGPGADGSRLSSTGYGGESYKDFNIYYENYSEYSAKGYSVSELFFYVASPKVCLVL